MESFSYGIAHLISAVEGIDKQMKVWNRNLTEARENLKIQNQIVSEPFAEAEKLKQKRSRYNEVMDILNPPKEEQKLDTDGGDAVQYQSRNYHKGWNSYELSDEFEREIDYQDRHAFLRSLANQTRNIPRGGERHITIFGIDKIYFFKAIGYMNGHLEKAELITAQNQSRLMDMRKEYIDGTDTGRKTFAQMAEDYELQRRRGSWNYDATGYTGVSGSNDAVDVEESDSNIFGSYWESLGYNSWEEVREAIENGAIIPDENGDIIVLEQYQQRHKVLTNREVLEMAVDELEVSDLTPGERSALDIYKSS